MSKPAARISDMHICPMMTPGVPPIPHVGGPILPPGSPMVLIGGVPAARVGDMAICVGPPDSIVLGSMSVLIGGMPAARMGDSTAHGGTVMGGLPTVLIGDGGGGGGGGSPQAAAMNAAKAAAAPLVVEGCGCQGSPGASTSGGSGTTGAAQASTAKKSGAAFMTKG